MTVRQSAIVRREKGEKKQKLGGKAGFIYWAGCDSMIKWQDNQ